MYLMPLNVPLKMDKLTHFMLHRLNHNFKKYSFRKRKTLNPENRTFNKKREKGNLQSAGTGWARLTVEQMSRWEQKDERLQER